MSIFENSTPASAKNIEREGDGPLYLVVVRVDGFPTERMQVHSRRKNAHTMVMFDYPHRLRGQMVHMDVYATDGTLIRST